MALRRRIPDDRLLGLLEESGRNLQRTHDHEAERQTVAAWNRYGA